MKKIIVLLLFSIFTVFVSGCSSTSNNVAVKNNDASIKTGIESYFLNKDNKKVSITVKSTSDIGTNKIVTFTTDNKDSKTGYGLVDTSSKDNCILVYVGSNNLLVDFRNVNDDKDNQYLVVMLKKYNIKPSKIKFKLDAREFTFDVPSSEYSIQTQKLEPKFGVDEGTGSMVSFYDDKNVDITDQIKLVE